MDKVRRLFLIDGLGALLSAYLLGIVLVRYEDYFGMPAKMLHLLALIAILLAFYSIRCFIRVPKKWGIYLRIIAKANFAYCLLTITLVIYFFDQLTWLGVTYFIAEILILLLLIRVELKGSL